MAVLSAPHIGYGATVSFNSVALGFVESIKPPEIHVPKVKATMLTSQNAGGQPHHIYIPGAIDYGEVEIELQYDAVNYQSLAASAAARTQASLVLTDQASGDTFTATAWVCKLSPEAWKTADEVTKYKADFALTSGFTYVEGSSSAVE